MTKSEVLEFLEKKRWTTSDQKELIDVWNELRGDALGKIGPNAVRTGCRLRQVRGALIKFANAEMV